MLPIYSAKQEGETGEYCVVRAVKKSSGIRFTLMTHSLEGASPGAKKEHQEKALFKKTEADPKRVIGHKEEGSPSREHSPKEKPKKDLPCINKSPKLIWARKHSP